MEESSQLTFDQAEYQGAESTGTPCSGCSAGLGHEYWTWEDRVLCTACKARTEQSFASARSAASFGKALLLGGLTALGCGIAYAVFVALTEIQLALATIGIAFVIAAVVRRAAQGVGSRRFQVLAVALTYFASAMGYAPAIWEGLKGAKSEQTSDSTDKSASPGTVTQASDAQAKAPVSVPSTTPPKDAPVSVGQFIGAILFLVGLTLAAPFLAFADAPIGFLIVLFGLWEAWKLSRAGSTSIAGPFQVAAAPMEASAT